MNRLLSCSFDVVEFTKWWRSSWMVISEWFALMHPWTILLPFHYHRRSYKNRYRWLKCMLGLPKIVTHLTTFVIPDNTAVRRLRQFVADLSPRSLEFAPELVHVGSEVDKVALGQVSLRDLRFSPFSIPPSSLSILYMETLNYQQL
jgi:hypothetical protein